MSEPLFAVLVSLGMMALILIPLFVFAKARDRKLNLIDTGDADYIGDFGTGAWSGGSSSSDCSSDAGSSGGDCGGDGGGGGD